MSVETETSPADSSPLADALVDFDSLGGASPADATVEAQDDGTSFMDEFNKEVEEPKPDETPEPAAEETKTDETPAAEEKDDIDEIEPPKNASKAAAENFQKIKDSAKQYKTKFNEAEKLYTETLAERDARIAELEARTADLPELSEKAKFAEEAERELAISRVEATREYKFTIDAPLRAIEDAALAIAKANDVDADEVLDAITEPDPVKRRELLKSVIANVDDVEKQEILRMASDTQDLLRKRDEIRGRATEALKEREEMTQAEQIRAQKKSREDFGREAENTISELRKRLPFVPLADGETADNVFNGLLDKAKATDFDAAPVANKAFAAAAAIALPRMVRQFAKVQAENKTLLARIAEGNKGRATVGDPAPAKVWDGEDFFENLGIADPGSAVKGLR